MSEKREQGNFIISENARKIATLLRSDLDAYGRVFSELDSYDVEWGCDRSGVLYNPRDKSSAFTVLYRATKTAGSWTTQVFFSRSTPRSVRSDGGVEQLLKRSFMRAMRILAEQRNA